MEKERKKMLNQLAKLVKKDGVYVAGSNNFSLEDINYLESLGIKASTVNCVRPGLIGDYEVEYVATKFEMVGVN